ncbi:MAG: ATP-dependent zinc metalloprotease FtsH [Chloroflexi bacterium]|nr:ATP-dependent zinc metalloprotease FtsH [Chloroflexota bacterium]MBV9899134.1 ATP-dependent zinc metalloprotease FtsH [Chloroflexota bacterium]
MAGVAFLVVDAKRTGEPQTIPLTELVLLIKDDRIVAIDASDSGGRATDRSGQVFSFSTQRNEPLLKALSNLGLSPDDLSHVAYTVADPAPAWLGIMLEIGPLVLFALVIAVAWRRFANRSQNPMQSFGQTKARVADGAQSTITFEDVAGIDEPRQELQEVVEFLKEPQKFVDLGARIPHGVLLVGPPGTGKTLLARAVAGEAGVPFFRISGSEFVEMFVGVGASRVRDLFANARKSAPCIVFVDEIDAVGRQRGAGVGNANDEREQTLNQILVEMDGFDDHGGVIVIAATNRPDVLDPALLRPGRFDRMIVVPAPDIGGRHAILNVHARGKPFDPDVALLKLAKQTPGFSGADLANVLNEAAILAARRDKTTIAMAEIEEAVDRVSAGPERKTRVMSTLETELTAYHESGHAVVSRFLTQHDPVHKITIIPRGLRIGYTRFLPPEDRSYVTRGQFRDAVVAALGGHAAETLVYGEVSTSSGDDIERATKIVRRMVTEFGMSERLGPVAFGRKQQMIFLGRDIGEQRDYSERIGEVIDEEIHRLLDEALARATAILGAHRGLLDRLARELVGRETLDAQALELIFEA